jgi:hypothetical protein
MAAFDEFREMFGEPTPDSKPDEVLAAFYGQWPPTVAWVPRKPLPPRPTLTFGWTVHDNGSG